MKRTRDVEAGIAAAYRVSRAGDSPGLAEAKRELLARIVAQPRDAAGPVPTIEAGLRERIGARLSYRRCLVLGASIAATAAIVLLIVGIGAGPAGSPTPALAAKLRLTKVSPHLLLEAPGWRIWGASEVEGGRGSIQFSHGNGEPVSYLGGRLSITFEAAAGLQWSSATPATKVHAPNSLRFPNVEYVFVLDAPVVGTTARVFARTVPRYKARQYVAVWIQDGRYLRFRSFAPSLTAFEHRLASLRLVSRARWLHALPTHTVRHKDWALVEAPGRREFRAHCKRPLTPALVAQDDNPKVRLVKLLCGSVSGFGD